MTETNSGPKYEPSSFSTDVTSCPPTLEERLRAYDLKPGDLDAMTSVLEAIVFSKVNFNESLCLTLTAGFLSGVPDARFTLHRRGEEVLMVSLSPLVHAKNRRASVGEMLREIVSEILTVSPAAVAEEGDSAVVDVTAELRELRAEVAELRSILKGIPLTSLG